LGVVKFIPGNRRVEINIPMFVIKEYKFIPWNKLYHGNKNPVKREVFFFCIFKRGVLFPSDDGGNFFSHVYGNQFLCTKAMLPQSNSLTLLHDNSIICMKNKNHHCACFSFFLLHRILLIN
jgi:hypothetical protein